MDVCFTQAKLLTETESFGLKPESTRLSGCLRALTGVVEGECLAMHKLAFLPGKRVHPIHQVWWHSYYDMI